MLRFLPVWHITLYSPLKKNGNVTPMDEQPLSRHEQNKQKREARDAARLAQHETTLHTQKTRKYTLILSIIIIVLVLGGGLWFYSGWKAQQPGPYDTFAQCLTEKGVEMYGTFWCPKCAEQKVLFGSSFKYLTYIECDARGKNADPQRCEAQSVTGYPTWIFGDKRLSGVQTLEALRDFSGCPLT